MAALLATILLSSLLLVYSADISGKIGVNYGWKGNNLPSPYQTIETVRSMNAGRIKLYDSDHEILKLLSGTNIHVSTMVPNNDIIRIASSQAAAEQWVQSNVLDFYPGTMIRFVLVGNEVLSHDGRIWPSLVPAMRRIKNSLNAHDIKNVKVSTSLAMNVLQSTFPPSSAWSSNSRNIRLDFALFRGTANQTDHNTSLVYTNLLDQMLDSVIFAMRKLGYPDIRLAVGETGWPNAGDMDQVGANINNAATYNRKLIQKRTTKPPIGTPARPGAVIPTFISSLYDENQRAGPTTERHWGLLRSNGTPIYDIDISGKRPLSSYKPLPAARTNVPYRGKLWCEVVPGANAANLSSALSYACSQGNQTCAALNPGQQCYEPVSMFRHASYAFSSYWSKFRKQGATCYFNGLARQTRRNPSRGRCNFPSVTP
ncbi:putative glucan endo-1,3-beta-glucosidase A6 [Hibiscus syriacus]|uniref:glucan endo-1,3-beta-D-glucosidase n=1 Tax=Hibiscus syriacus TaxID=106335 RepID=A0A6A3CY98_HIBSY|nr:putative glucan endo-1,3-beta-glucosidase A6 [Hibiscus syriacus]